MKKKYTYGKYTLVHKYQNIRKYNKIYKICITLLKI